MPNSSAPKASPHGPWRVAVIIGSLCLGILLYGIDINIIGTAIPRITTDFHSLSDVSWYGSAYLLTVTAFQPLFGNLYKFFNAKVVYLLSLLIFEVGSIVCATSPSSAVLIFARALLGFGAAGLLQGALAIIGYVVPLDKVPLFQGVVVSALGISVAIGPVIGGALTEHVSWRWCFWINVPIGGFVILAILAFVPLQQSSNQQERSLPIRSKVRHMDIIGIVLFIGAVTSFLLAVTWGGQTYPWSNSRIIGLFVSFGILTILFAGWLWKRGETALIPLRVLRQRSIAMGSLTLFLIGIANQIYAFYLPIFFQSVQGVSTTQSGVQYLALVLPQIVALVVAGGLVSQLGVYVPFLVVGLGIGSIGAGLLTTIDVTTSTAKWAAFMVITGIGTGMAQNLPISAVQAVLDQKDVPTGNAIVVFSLQLGGALGLAIGQNLLIQKLGTAVLTYTSAVSPSQVIAAGASGLPSLTLNPSVLHALRTAYSDAVHYTLILALAGTALAILPAGATENLNIKTIANERLRAKSMETEMTETEGKEKNGHTVETVEP
ncbi:MFS multidrug transporter-like protein [Nemania sp. FL0916]|nr:MFS multidrug transporter-like protein [Nemania sp. FL0916]